MPLPTDLSPQLIAAIEAGACVVTTNQRSAHALRLRYANLALERGLKAWATPNVLSLNAFVSQLWRDNADSGERVLTPQQSYLVWERIVGESHWVASLLSPQAAAELSYRSWERMQAWRISTADLRGEVSKHASDEAMAMADWCERFAIECDARKWLPAQLVASRLSAMPLRRLPTYIVVTASELLPQHTGLLAKLESMGSRVELTREPLKQAQISVQQCPTLDIELAAAAHWACDLVKQGSRSVGVVVPQLQVHAARVRRAFADVFAQSLRTWDTGVAGNELALQEKSFALACYRSLGDFPVVSASLSILEFAVGRVSSALVGSLIRSPYILGARTEAALRARMDWRIREQTREHYDIGTTLSLAGECPALRDSLLNLQESFLQSHGRHLASGWAEKFVAFWKTLGWPGDMPLESEEQQALARLQEALGEFGALDDLLGPMSVSQAVRKFALLVREVSFEARSAPAPVTIIDTESIEGIRFDALWVTGVDESRWPPPPSPDAFIPIAIQRRCNMPNATASLARDKARQSFDSLCGLAERVILSFARTVDEVDVQPSPWLNQFSTETLTTPANDSFAHRVFAERPSLLQHNEAKAPAFAGERAPGGTRIFELQSQCPFRAFAELRLGAKPLDEVAPEVDARERGILIHAAMADLWQEMRTRQALRDRPREEVASQVRTYLARHAEKLLNGASAHRVRMLQIEQELAFARILEMLDLDRNREDFKIVGKPESSETKQIGGLKFSLRLDRVDELTDAEWGGARVIVDYKTGSNVSAASWYSDRPSQPQLPLYAVTHAENLAAVAFATVSAQGVAYKGLAEHDGILPGIRAFAGQKNIDAPQDWRGLLAHWTSVIESLADEFASGRADVDPLPNACRYCHLTALCRVAEVNATAENGDEDRESEL